MPNKRIRTTIDIPIELSERLNKALHKKCAPSRNALANPSTTAVFRIPRAGRN